MLRRDKKEDCLQLRNDDERGRREEDEEQGGGMAVVMDRTPRENIVAGGAGGRGRMVTWKAQSVTWNC